MPSKTQARLFGRSLSLQLNSPPATARPRREGPDDPGRGRGGLSVFEEGVIERAMGAR